jgi:hypothetical protein
LPALRLLNPLSAQEVDKMKRGFEEQMTKMRGEVSKIQEEKVHLMGLEQRLRQEFQTQVKRAAALEGRGGVA